MPSFLLTDDKTYPEDDMDDFINELARDMQDMREYILENDPTMRSITDDEEEQLRNVNYEHKLVWVKELRPRDSLAPKYHGPYEVLAVE